MGIGLIVMAGVVLGPMASTTFGQDTQDAILQELKEIRKLLEENLKRGGIGVAKTPPPSEKLDGVPVVVKGNPFKGSPTARVTIVEFSDYQCPFCARHVRQTLPMLEEEFIQKGLVKYVFRDFPLNDLHPTATALAIGASCAGEQRKYWEMHDFLFANQPNLGPARIEEQVTSLGMSMEEFRNCVTREATQQEVQQDVTEGRQLGLNGTPSFFFGLTQENDRDILARYVFRGALPYKDFKKVLEELLE